MEQLMEQEMDGSQRQRDGKADNDDAGDTGDGDDHGGHDDDDRQQTLTSRNSPEMLGPSVLGTKSYWDELYAGEIKNLSLRRRRATTKDDAPDHHVHDDDEKQRRRQQQQCADSMGEDGGGRRVHEDEDDNVSRESEDEDDDGDEGEEEEEDDDDDALSTNWFSEQRASEKIVSFLDSIARGADDDDDDDDGVSFSQTRSALPQLSRDTTSFLDLGTGNGHLLFDIREQGLFRGPMVGVDYSEESVRLANEMLCCKRRRRRSRRRKERLSSESGTPVEAGAEKKMGDEKDLRHREDLYADIRFEKWDILSGECIPSSCLLDGSDDGRHDDMAFDVLLDKGTFDAISLDPALHDKTSNNSKNRSQNHNNSTSNSNQNPNSSTTTSLNNTTTTSNCDTSPNETSSLDKTISFGSMYINRLTPLMKRGTGMLIVTSCNWTEDELCSWFTTTTTTTTTTRSSSSSSPSSLSSSPQRLLEPVAKIAYPTFTFAGKKGQSISSVVFRRRG